MEKIRIGDLLIEAGYISKEQLDDALAIQRQQAEETGEKKRIGEILIDEGYITDNQANQAIAKRLGISVIDLSETTIEASALMKIPEKLAKSYDVVGYKEDDKYYYIAISDPLDFYAIEDIRQITQANLHVSIDTRENIRSVINKNYGMITAKYALSHAANKKQQEAELVDELADEADYEAPIIQALNRLLLLGENLEASDIHIEPFEEEVVVRMRVDGVIKEVTKLNKNIHLPLITRIKIMAEMDIAERRLPQDGHFITTLEDTKINARVSIVPTVMGEKAVIRFIREEIKIDRGNQFGMDDKSYKTFEKILSVPYGMVYITGPTGSGKTTTLYMVLEEMGKREINIETIEDPVEKKVPNVCQIQVNNQSGLTFSEGLRSLLRQDPDVIMIGETRDAETAEIAVRAAITGHVVFSTLHTNDALSAIVRLKEMGVPSYLVGNALSGLVAQRLVRKLCPDCKEKVEATPKECMDLGVSQATIYKPKGCNKCGHSGYKGRIAIHEVVAMTKELRKMVVDDISIEDMESYLREKHDYTTIPEQGKALVLEGTTSMEELAKVVYFVD